MDPRPWFAWSSDPLSVLRLRQSNIYTVVICKCLIYALFDVYNCLTKAHFDMRDCPTYALLEICDCLTVTVQCKDCLTNATV